MGLLSRTRAKATAALTAPPALAARLEAADQELRAVERVHRKEVAAYTTPKFAETPFGQALAQAPDEQLRTAALWAHRRLCAVDHPSDAWPEVQLLTALARKKVAWTSDEVAWALDVALARRGREWGMEARIRLPLGAAERLSNDQLDPLRGRLDEFRRRVGGAAEILLSSERQRLLRRLDAVLADPDAATTELPPSILHAGDPFGPATRVELGARLQAPGVAALLVHAASASTPNPSPTWLKRGRALLDEVAAGEQLVQDLLTRSLHHRESLQRIPLYDGDFWVWIHESTALLLRGLVAIAGTLDAPWVTPLLGELALYAGGGLGGSASAPRDIVVANAAIAALAKRSDAVPHLARAQARFKHRGILKGVTKGLETAAANAGMTRSELLETAVPTHGLDGAGERREQLGEHTAVLAVSAPGTVSLAFENAAGKRLAGVPAAVKEQHAEALAELRAEVKEIKKTLTTERLRIEGLLAEGRTWQHADWVRLYRDHPLLGRLVRGLLWQVSDDGDLDGTGWRTGRLLDDGTLSGLDGTELDLGARVRLWHPARADADEVRAWRELLLDVGIRQPFKQAFREIYLLTPAELNTGDHSNRFAAHILRAPQAQALMRVRGWGGTSLGYYDGGYEGDVAREFGDDWRAEFYFDLVEDDDDGYGTPSLASSDQVRFSRREGNGWSLRPLSEVPPLIFTEAMRDVDLFVGVTSIAADPTWITRGARDHTTYWHSASFGELNESAKTRHEALQRLVPRLKIAQQCTLSDRFLEVRGQLRTYKIHLGSGNILMKPNDEYLCIVKGRGDKGPKVFLPFEEDGGMLSVILSKAFLLADDRSITDRSILSQINGR